MQLPTPLSRRATSNGHGEDSPYFDGWKAYDRNPYHPHKNPSGVIQMGLAENQLSFDLIEKWVREHPESSICTQEGIAGFKETANYQDYHGLPKFREGITSFMEEVGGGKAKFDKDRIVLTAGATAAHEVLTFCVANPGEAFLIPSPYYPGFDRDLKWRTGVELIPVVCSSSNNFQVSVSALEEAYTEAKCRKVKVKGILITNPSNPLGTTMDEKTLRSILHFATEKKIHLICDEIYAGSVFLGPRFVSIAEVVQSQIERDHVHIVYSLSKDMGLPGFRVGAIYSYNNKVVMAARRMSSFCMVSSQTQYLLGKMLSDRLFVREYIKENKKRLQEAHSVFVQGLCEVGIKCLANSNVGLFCWVDLRHLLHKDSELALWKIIIEEIGLNVSPGLSCHCKEEGWFRFCFANMTPTTMQESLTRIKRLIERRSKVSTISRSSALTFHTTRPKNLSLSIDRAPIANMSCLNSPCIQIASKCYLNSPCTPVTPMYCFNSPHTPITSM
ncbi:hypothetical protein SUGI_0833430 [Cryptomeria japonica]|uniref:1-aminocyclopropane-1-carboxylate synthase n=1 Tax=Cryptomeria japonica TaxID=3369 RepID=UPI002414B17C|nr:1-aminocyclopropane-1-carboxylate synthase [Cryptomeria japonica]GLJ40450.1 hypothetical protein SUGI_0833430 [Cryptomeria japonica]